MSAFLNMLYEQLFLKPTYPTQNHTGQTIIITGGNTGLGLEAARHITRLDAEKVILAVRTTEKGETAKKSIEESTGRQGVVEVWSLDLSSYESVKQFAKKVEGLKRVDALVANAGIAASEFKITEEDESMITTNVVSTTLLAILLLPKLRESASRYNITPHLSFVSSEVHGFTPFPERNSPDIFKALNDPEKFNMDERYPVSKLMGLFTGRELASLSSKSSHPEVIINFTNPGLCHSELSRDGPWSFEIMKFFLARSTEVGSRNLVYAASAGAETNGMYLSSCRIAKPSPLVRSEEGATVQKKIWDEMARKFERIQPGIMGLI